MSLSSLKYVRKQFSTKIEFFLSGNAMHNDGTQAAAAGQPAAIKFHALIHQQSKASQLPPTLVSRAQGIKANSFTSFARDSSTLFWPTLGWVTVLLATD